MIKDLQLAGDATVVCDAQVCIIGAGMAGLFLAHLLREQGVQVVLLEAGTRVARGPAEIDQRCEQNGVVYGGAELGRSFGLGGTSVIWGGQMIPMMESDFGARPDAGKAAWPIAYSEVAKYFPVVQRHLGISAGGMSTASESDDLLQSAYPELYKFGSGFDLRLSTWLPFGKRNFAQSFSVDFDGDETQTVWLNSAVTELTRSSDSGRNRIETVTAQSPNGRVLKVRASVVVVCAGALESTRILLAFDEASEGSITRAGAPLGRYFHDHLSATCGHFVCRDLRRYNLAVAPVFRNGLMRTPRLELTPEMQRELGLPSAFAHFTFLTTGNTGFDIARKVLRGSQRDGRSLGLSPTALGPVFADLLAMAYWRGIHRRLWIPRQAGLMLQVDIEQASNQDNRLYLSAERDALNRKRLAIDWRITPADVRTVRKMAEITAQAWNRSPLSRIAEFHAASPAETDSFDAMYDVYHPSGSIQMGSSPAKSVVDGDLRLWSTRNCFVSTTAVFPSTGSANPGMTHLALTARLAESIAREFRA